MDDSNLPQNCDCGLWRFWAHKSVDLAEKNADLRAERNAAQEDRSFLWQLLDDIDTIDDAAKDNDKRFRDMVRAVQQRRFEISRSDGYTVSFTRDPL